MAAGTGIVPRMKPPRMLRPGPCGVHAAVALALALAVVGCGKDDRAGATTGPAAAPAEVRIGYFANLTHAQAVLGVASGDFEKAVAPSKIKARVFNAGPSLIE